MLMLLTFGGEGGIRTPDSLATMSVFETDTFDHSVTSPRNSVGSHKLLVVSHDSFIWIRPPRLILLHQSALHISCVRLSIYSLRLKHSIIGGHGHIYPRCASSRYVNAETKDFLLRFTSADKLLIPSYSCGNEGIRTLGQIALTHAFQACPFDHSGTFP